MVRVRLSISKAEHSYHSIAALTFDEHTPGDGPVDAEGIVGALHQWGTIEYSELRLTDGWPQMVEHSSVHTVLAAAKQFPTNQFLPIRRR